MVKRHELPVVITSVDGKEEASLVVDYVLGVGYGDIRLVVRDHQVATIDWTERIVRGPTQKLRWPRSNHRTTK